MAITDFLTQTPDFQTMSTLDPDQQRLFGEASGVISGGLNRGGFSGDLTARLSPGLSNVQAWLSNQVKNLGQFDTASASAIQRGLSGQPSTSISPQATLDAWRKGIFQPGLQALQEDAIPMLKDMFAQQGASFSSRLSESGRRLTSDFTRSATSVLQEMLREDRIRSEGYAESAANRSVQTIPLAQQAGLSQAAQGSALTNALLPFQNFDQATLDRLRQEFYTINPYLASAL